jgi:hypothetical protein
MENMQNDIEIINSSNEITPKQGKHDYTTPTSPTQHDDTTTPSSDSTLKNGVSTNETRSSNSTMDKSEMADFLLKSLNEERHVKETHNIRNVKPDFDKFYKSTTPLTKFEMMKHTINSLNLRFQDVGPFQRMNVVRQNGRGGNWYKFSKEWFKKYGNGIYEADDALIDATKKDIVRCKILPLLNAEQLHKLHEGSIRLRDMKELTVIGPGDSVRRV